MGPYPFFLSCKQAFSPDCLKGLAYFSLVCKIFSAGLEILEEIPEPDVVIVCCGGGGLLSGVAAAIKLLGNKTTRIFGVEPEGGRYLILRFFICR